MDRDKLTDQDKWKVNESRSVRSIWVWKGFLLMALLAAGVAILLADNHYNNLAIGWGVIAAGWFGVAMFLWKRHLDQNP